MRKCLPPLPILIFLIALSITYASLVDVNDFVEVNVLSLEGNTIIIGRDCKALVADTSPERALSIELGSLGRIEGRPMTHDTFVEVLKNFNITLDSVKITRYQDEYYYSDIIFVRDKKVLELDAVPSDGIALAVRVDAPIYINQTLLEENGLNIC